MSKNPQFLRNQKATGDEGPCNLSSGSSHFSVTRVTDETDSGLRQLNKD